MKDPKPERLVVIEGMPIYANPLAASSCHLVELFAYHSTFGGGVTPRLVVAREHAHMATADELLVIETQDRVVAVKEIGVEDDLHAVAGAVEELDATELVQHWVGAIVEHVVCDYRRQRVALESEYSSFQCDLVLSVEKIIEFRILGVWFTECVRGQHL